MKGGGRTNAKERANNMSKGMRKDARARIETNISHVQGYHAGASFDEQEYAFEGFTGNWYFNSDRCIALTPNYLRNDGQPLQGYGLEIETECRGIGNTTVLAEVFTKIILPRFKFGTKMFKLQRDGSLRGDSSVEVITQIMTKSRIRNDYAAYKAMFDDYFKAFNISANSATTNCGMHVNISNALFGKDSVEIAEGVRKLYYIINKHYRLFCIMFKRPFDKTNWCAQMTAEHLERNGWDDWTRHADLAAEYEYNNARNIDLTGNVPNSHHNCVNLSHFGAGRVEIRLVGGQKDYYSFRNTMETVFHLVARCRTISWADCDDIVKIFKGCNQYVVKRLADAMNAEEISCDVYYTLDAAKKEENLELT